MANGTGWKEEYLDENGRTHDGSQEKEEKFFDQIAEQIKRVINHFAKRNGSPMRGNHAKILAGIVGAEFQVSHDIPSDLSVGFLAKPGTVYKAHIRFSNAGSKFRKDDSQPDLRGAAIRIMTEQGDHDFLMTNAEPHHAKDAREAMAAITTGIDKDIAENIIPGQGLDGVLGGLVAFGELSVHLGPLTALHIARTLKDQMHREVTSLATETYWSRAPIAIGNVPDPAQSVAVKYKLEPVAAGAHPTDNKQNLGQGLKNRISEQAVKFLFRVQRYIDPKKTPIEDATKSWESEFESIAELTIPQGVEINDDFINSLVFNPWNVDSKAFQPLGSMNRSRKKVYRASASLR